MRIIRDYGDYNDYISHQKEKTLDPVRRKKWLNEEWDLKLSGFLQIFGGTCENILTDDMNALCLGARTGQEVVALRQLGLDAIGIDLVPCEPHVIAGDIHNLDFDDKYFDFVFTNIFDHSLNPQKMISEAERVLKPNGLFLMQLQVDQGSDEYAENEIDSVAKDIHPLFKNTKINTSREIPRNFAGMNWEILTLKEDGDNEK